jgi:hypothetical protein
VSADIERRVRKICLALPEVTEKVTHGAPGFFVRKQFAMLWPNGHHDHDFAHLWCAAQAHKRHSLANRIATSARRTSVIEAGSDPGWTAWSTGMS